MNLDQLFYFRSNYVIASLAVVKNPEAIIGFFRPVDAHRNADVVLRKKADDFRSQHRSVGGHAEVDVLAHLSRLGPGVLDRRFHDFEVEQSLATEKRQVNRAAPG